MNLNPNNKKQCTKMNAIVNSYDLLNFFGERIKWLEKLNSNLRATPIISLFLLTKFEVLGLCKNRRL
jgi:hypothetical protein